MKNNFVFAITFICFYNIQIARAEFLNLGGAEIVLILVAMLFLLGGVIGVILLISYLTRKPNKENINYPQNNIKINFEAHNLNPVEKNKGQTKISLPQQNELRYVLTNDIFRCEADNNYTNFYLTDGDKILISKPLKEYSDMLKPHGFIRTHQSHLVNPIFVKSWLKEDGGILLMENGDKIPVSKPNREMVRAVLGN